MADSNKLFETLGLRIPEILLPAADIDYSRFAVIACDQHSAEPEYWEETERIVGDSPSALRMILPEAYLAKADSTVNEKINATMDKYLADGTLQNAGTGFIYLKRQTATGIRKGIVAAIDLEQYDYEPGSSCLIRASEATVKERLPARIVIRKKASLEMPHVMLLMDDKPENLSFYLDANTDRMKKLYDFELCQGGGHIEGYLVSAEEMFKDIASILLRLKENSSDGLLFAVGDGNHSLAAAKECWNQVKEKLTEAERADHPMRFALVEIVNIYDEGLSFHPIHRLLYNVDPEKVQAEVGFDAANPISLQDLQPMLDKWFENHPEAEIEYIHGDEECRKLGDKPDRLSIIFDHFDRDSFFDTVRNNGTFVRKSFSIGTAAEKRYYLECRKIK